MAIRSALLLFLSCVSVSASSSRHKRFLNAEVHNRIDVLSKSHAEHQEQTSILRNIVFGSTITLSVLFLLSILGLLLLCLRFRRHRRGTLSSSLPIHTTPSPPSTFDPMALLDLARLLSNAGPTHQPHSRPMLRF